MIELKTTPADIVAAKSTHVVRVTGRGVWNPHHPHRVLRRSDGSMVLQAEATVLSARPTNHREEVAGTIAIGDRLKVDGAVYEVRARTMADPELILTSSPDGAEADPYWFAPEPRDVTDGIDIPSYGS